MSCFGTALRATPSDFGARLSLLALGAAWENWSAKQASLRDQICLAILTTKAARWRCRSRGSKVNWRRPFVCHRNRSRHCRIGELRSISSIRPRSGVQLAPESSSLGLIIAVLVTAIGVGSWLIVST